MGARFGSKSAVMLGTLVSCVWFAGCGETPSTPDSQKTTARAPGPPPQPPQPPSAPQPPAPPQPPLSPLPLPGGKVDYIAALNERVRQGVTPDNNSALLFLQALGSDALLPETRQQYLQVLGVGSPVAQGPFFVDYSTYAEDASAWRSARRIAAE